MQKLNERGSTIIVVIAVALIMNIMLLGFFFSTRQNNKVSSVRKLDITSLNIAEGGKEHFYADLINNICIPLRDTSIDWFLDKPFKNGTYSVAYTSKTWADTLWITSKGSENGSTSIIDVIAKINPYLNINNPPVRGAITAHSRVEVTGSIVIDGRDHDTLCDSVAPGVYGVSTCDSLEIKGSAMVGGGGFKPRKRQQFDAIREFAADEKAATSSIFSSPEAFLGLPDGALNQYKSNDPNIPENFRALIYKTCDVGPVHFGDAAGGILIVHNDTKTAQLSVNNGEFRGLIIVDDFTKIAGNVTIHGAIVALKDSTVIVDGVGNGTICYSSEILHHLSSYCNNFRKSVDEVSWKERTHN